MATDGLRFKRSSRRSTELVASLPGFATVTDVVPLVAGAAVARAITLPVGTVAETITVGCSVTSVATAAPLARQSVTMQMPQSADVVLPSPASAGLESRARGDCSGALRTTAEGRGAVAGPGASRRQRPSAQETHERQADVPGDSDPGPGHDCQARWPPWCGRLHERVDPMAAEPGAEPPAEFTESAIDAARQWTFTPTLLNGVPVEVNITVQVVYFRFSRPTPPAQR